MSYLSAQKQSPERLQLKTCVVTSLVDDAGVMRRIVHATRLQEELKPETLGGFHRLDHMSFEELEGIAAGLVMFQQAVEMELASRWKAAASKGATCALCQPALAGVSAVCDECERAIAGGAA